MNNLAGTTLAASDSTTIITITNTSVAVSRTLTRYTMLVTTLIWLARVVSYDH